MNFRPMLTYGQTRCRNGMPSMDSVAVSVQDIEVPGHDDAMTGLLANKH